MERASHIIGVGLMRGLENWKASRFDHPYLRYGRMMTVNSL
jgi:hypothetical protein